MGKKKETKMSGALRGRLQTVIRQNRRETVYRMLCKQNNGKVPCYVCRRHVPLQHATLEHILPLSQGGTDDMDNLSISHKYCNQNREIQTQRFLNANLSESN